MRVLLLILASCLAASAPAQPAEGEEERTRRGERMGESRGFLEVGQMIPDLELVDDQGNPAKLRELTRGHYTSITLGCLT